MAIDIHRLHALSFWGALLMHAARSAKCRVPYTEGPRYGTVVESVRIENPFITST